MRIKNKGVAFIITLIIIAIMSAAIILFSTMIMQNTFDARKEMNSMAALYVAEAGANIAVRDLQKGGLGNIGNTAFGKGTYEVFTTGGVISSTGIVKGRSRRVRLNVSNPKAAFTYGVFTDGIQEYQGGGSSESVVINGNVHSNNSAPHINNPNHLIVGSGYTAESGPDYGFPDLDITYYQTLASIGADNHYYTDGSDLGNIVLPQSGGVTLVKLIGADAGEDIALSGNGNGLVIVIGANVVMSGSDLLTGLLYVNDSNMDGTGLGGNVRIGGNYKVIGTVASRSVNTIHGTNTVTYSPTAFSINDLQVDIDKIAVYSWQGS